MTYGELRVYLSEVLNRTDLAALYPQALQLVRARIFNGVRLRNRIVPVSVDVSSGVWTLPDDFAGMHDVLGSVDGQNKPLEQATYETVIEATARQTGLRFYCISGGQALFSIPATNDPATVIARYYAHPPNLTADVDTDIVLTRYPRCYLYGMLSEIAQIIQDERRAEWSSLCDVALQELEVAERRDRFGRIAPRLTASTTPV